MLWEPGTLLGLQNPSKPLGRYPGGSLFVMLEACTITGSPILLGSDGRKAIIPACYLVAIRGVTGGPPGPTPAGGKG